ncbi:MAG: type III pantothenate kinase [Gammaproteobacteria bacterium]|jgi:type III pantothenate kinase|nr:type III pantothenate kinase [Gammaproteobacteria bacterium]MBT7602942.1 type III pantothenate kinase [Gammaproteobacteria bacterium]
MNLYAIDFGHTNYKIAIIENKNIISVITNNYNDKPIRDELNSLMKNSLCEKILCSSVLDEGILNSILNKLPEDMRNIFKFFKPEDCAQHFSLSYKHNKNRMGVDRALNLVAASKKTTNNLIVIDSGTATTIDYLDSDKNHVGGIILPGKKLIDNIFFEILDFDFYDEEYDDDIFSTNTRSCIENGSIISAYQSINIVLDKMIKLKNNNLDIYVTGGNASLVIDNCNYPLIHVESLLFEGLVVLEG